VRVMAALTVLASAPPPDSFRPPYVGSDKSIRHTLAEARISSLPRLSAPASTPSVDLILSYFEKPWIEHMYDWEKQLFCAPDNMPIYGATIAEYVSTAASLLVLNIDQTKKATLAARIIQLGLDNYGITQVPMGNSTWTANGGHMPGRAFPIIFAGYALGDSVMLGLMQKTGQYAYQNGHYETNIPADYVHFGEIDQTFYVTQRDVDRTHSPGWIPDYRATAIPYEAIDIGKPEWGIGHVYWPQGDNNNIDATYRPVNLPPWIGFIVASRVLGLQGAWNHPALFDYVDRWMSQRQAQNGFMQDMWNAYRLLY